MNTSMDSNESNGDCGVESSSNTYEPTRVLRIDPLVGLKKEHLYFGDGVNVNNWKTILERILFKMITSIYLVPLVLLIQYLILALYGYYVLDWEANLVLVLASVVGSTASKKYIAYSISDQQLDIETTMNNERKRILISLVAFTLRFLLCGKVKIIILPIYLCIVMSTANLSKEYLLYSLIPIYYTCVLHFGGAMVEFYQYGVTKESVTFFAENFGIILSILVLSFHIMTTSENLKLKVITLEKTREQLEEALSAKQRFLRHISHEFRSPCLSSLGSVELLRETNLTKEQQELVETIASSEGILLNLIEDILTVAKLEHEKETPKQAELTEFNLGKCISLIGTIINSYAKHFNVKLEIVVDSTKYLIVRANQTKIHQVLSNLLTNAIKASKGGQTVHLICKSKGKQYTEHEMTYQDVEFLVSDNGSGIPKHKQKEIFAPFSQLHNVNENIYPGSGLGLNIVSNHVTSMRGTIDLRSETDQGSEFTITLPLEIVMKNCTKELEGSVDTLLKRQLGIQENYFKLFAEPYLEEKLPPKANAQIIIADDNPINRKVIFKLIQSLGYETDCASNGKELLESVDSNKHRLVITDINMPIMDGIEAATLLRKKFNDSISIVALTGDVLVNYPSNLFDSVIVKPCQRSMLKACIELALDKHDSSQVPSSLKD